VWEDLEERGPEVLVTDTIAVERFVLVTAYMIRKLFEADALTEELTEFRWPIARMPCTAEPPHRRWLRRWDGNGRSWQDLASHYDFKHATAETVTLSRLCDRLVHHFAFETRWDAGGGIDIIFNSDRTASRSLYKLSLDTYMALVWEVQGDEVRSESSKVDEGSVRLRRTRPPGWPA
jgi:hypothetical protein